MSSSFIASSSTRASRSSRVAWRLLSAAASNRCKASTSTIAPILSRDDTDGAERRYPSTPSNCTGFVQTTPPTSEDGGVPGAAPAFTAATVLILLGLAADVVISFFLLHPWKVIVGILPLKNDVCLFFVSGRAVVAAADSDVASASGRAAEDTSASSAPGSDAASPSSEVAAAPKLSSRAGPPSSSSSSDCLPAVCVYPRVYPPTSSSNCLPVASEYPRVCSPPFSIRVGDTPVIASALVAITVTVGRTGGGGSMACNMAVSAKAGTASVLSALLFGSLPGCCTDLLLRRCLGNATVSSDCLPIGLSLSSRR
mmetsp:Transcript_2063/g.4786  ORF Transcript_2063/g.4786 Transcript_2063/m.4786 type:complete len:312 (-) Transcript_2063:1660-2595(-)